MPHHRGHQQAQRHVAEHQECVVQRIGEDHVAQPRLERHLHAAWSAGDLEVIGEGHSDLVEGQRGDGEERATQPERRPEDHRADHAADHHSGQDAEPRRQPEAHVKDRRHVRPDREENTVAQRELPAKARDDVPGDGQPGEQVGVDQDVEPELVTRKDGKRRRGQGQRDQRQLPSAHPRLACRHRPRMRRCHRVNARGFVHQFCSLKPISSAPTCPNSPVGRTTSTATKMRNQIACLSSGSMKVPASASMTPTIRPPK